VSLQLQVNQTRSPVPYIDLRKRDKSTPHDSTTYNIRDTFPLYLLCPLQLSISPSFTHITVLSLISTSQPPFPSVLSTSPPPPGLPFPQPSSLPTLNYSPCTLLSSLWAFLPECCPYSQRVRTVRDRGHSEHCVQAHADWSKSGQTMPYVVVKEEAQAQHRAMTFAHLQVCIGEGVDWMHIVQHVLNAKLI
jgi:hypothetical protein